MSDWFEDEDCKKEKKSYQLQLIALGTKQRALIYRQSHCKIDWRRVRDSNPRCLSAHDISSVAPSTARTTLPILENIYMNHKTSVGFFKTLPPTSGYFREEGKKVGKKFLSHRTHRFKKSSNHAGLRYQRSE